MSKQPRVLAVIPARGGSKGLPGKNIRPLMGLPLIAHAIAMAGLCPEIDRAVVSTDSEQIADVARAHGGEVPFMRPAELARDETPMWPVIQHALRWAEQDEGRSYDFVTLLDCTSPGRMPEDVTGGLAKLGSDERADGIIGVSEPEFNPIWHCVVEKDGLMADLIPEGAKYTRRQDVPTVYRINAILYIWRAEFVRTCEEDWRTGGRYLLWEVPETRAIHIDHIEDFEHAEMVIGSGAVKLPWLKAEEK